MSGLNKKSDLNERGKLIEHEFNKNIELNFDEKNASRKSNVELLLHCKNYLKHGNSCLHRQKHGKNCLHSPFRFHSIFLLVLIVLMFFVSVGAASTVSAPSPTTSSTPSRGRWCQKVLKEEKTRERTDTKLCSENYNSSCGFFSFNTCVFVRYKICSKTYNHTFLVSKSVMDCCPGWAKKDNDTCIEVAQKPRALPSIHELSLGTFAAICSAGAFLMVIVFFIVKAVWKKKRKEKAAAESVHLEQLESLNAAQPQQVPLIPPQPVMANPHSLDPLKSTLPPDNLDVEAAAAAVLPAKTTTTSSDVPVKNHEELSGMKILQKIPETNGTTGATNASDSDTIIPENTENTDFNDPPELQVELFIREEGDGSRSESSNTHLQTQILPENSTDKSQDTQLEPKV